MCGVGFFLFLKCTDKCMYKYQIQIEIHRGLKPSHQNLLITFETIALNSC